MPDITLPKVTIRSIAVAPLFGESPKGGWSAEIKPEDSVHALIAVHTEEGITGHGSVFTDGRLVQAAVDVLEPLWRGENALEPERVAEKLHQNSFWMGAAAASPMRSAASTSRCGTFWAKALVSPWGDCSAGPIATASRPIARC